MSETTKAKIPVENNMWEVKAGIPYLIGSVCKDCGEVFFPQKEINICSNCQGERIEPLTLSREGNIHSFTVVHQAPAGGFYKGSVPFIYVLIELPEGVYVQAHLIHADADKVGIGDRVEVVLDTLFEENEQEIISYKFQPITEIRREQ